MGSLWIPWLADAARLTGHPVVEHPGWRTRGHGGMRLVEGVVVHHTADGPTGDYPSLRIVRDGRAGLTGPLSQLGLGRSGTIHVIAAGQTWQAGASKYAGFTDLNDEFIGIEAESVGTRDDWTPQQRDCYPRLCAALLYYMRRGADRVCAHKEVCIPRGRKIDPAYWDMTQLRATVEWYLADPLGRIPRYASTAPAKPTAASPRTGRRTLRRGDSGADVTELQTVLAAWYPTLRLAVDGDYGQATVVAVRHLQVRAGLTVDGVAGPDVYRVLGR